MGVVLFLFCYACITMCEHVIEHICVYMGIGVCMCEHELLICVSMY